VLGVIATACKDRVEIVALVGIGLCGGFTTFSTFSLETVKLLEAGRTPAALAYVLASVLAAITGAWLGIGVAKSLNPT
jgi:CrcB protein